MLKDNPEESIENCMNEINKINPLAKIVKTQYSKISVDFFLEEFENFNKSDQLNSLNSELFDKQNINKSNSEECSHQDHVHNINCSHLNQIDNIMVKTNIDNLDTLDTSIGRILWDLSDDNDFSIIRLKGIVKIKSENDSEYKIYSLQGLYDIYEFSEVKVSDDNNLKIQLNDGTFISKILFIGKNVSPNKNNIESVLNE